MYFSLWQTFFFVLAVSCIFLMATCPDQAAAAQWKERLLSEAPPKWAALEQYYAKVEVSYRSIFRETPKGPGQFPDIAYFDIRKNGDWMVSTLRRVGKWSEGRRLDTLDVNGVNSRYAFTLGKTAPDAASFILTNFQSASVEARQKVHSRGEHAFGIVFESGRDCIPLPRLIKDQSVTIIDVQGVQHRERKLIELRYDRQLGMRDQAKGIEHGTVILDADHCWCVCEDHSDLPNCKLDRFMEYGDDVAGFPILRRERHSTSYKDSSGKIDIGKGKLTVISEFDKLVHHDYPESEFTLTAFGLPEVAVPGEQSPRTLWRWLIGIGVGLGVLTILLRGYAKKKRQRPQST